MSVVKYTVGACVYACTGDGGELFGTLANLVLSNLFLGKMNFFFFFLMG